jgi:3-dehydroquinate dehydratase-2
VRLITILYYFKGRKREEILIYFADIYTFVFRWINVNLIMKIQIINGPNLNLQGKREPEKYGTQSFEDYLGSLKKQFPGVKIDYFQSNVEGEIINKIHETGFEYDGIILNAGGYTHTSVSIADAVAGVNAPVIEVHITNISAREGFRHNSIVGRYCSGSIIGLGLFGYKLAIEATIQAANSLLKTK